MKSCTKDEIRKKWKELKKNPDLIYSDGKTIFNYIGRLKDAPDTPCIDYIAKLILEDFIILEKIGTNVDDCRHSKFFNMNHDGTSNPKKRIEKHGEITFNENQFGMALYNSCHSFSFGKIFDYQLSLNQKKSSKCGKIDLLSKINNEIYVIELKVPYTNPKKKTETLLRAIIESFTFTKLLSIQKDKFIKDMKDMKHMKLSEKIKLRPVVLTLNTNTICAENMKNLETCQLKNFKNLIDKMNKHFDGKDILPFKFFAIEGNKGNNPKLKQDNEKRIVFEDRSFVKSKVIEYN